MRRCKHEPVRTCVACRTRRDQRSLVRVVRGPDGKLSIYASRREGGRGAYICPNSECWQKALKSNRLEHSLRSRLTTEDRDALLQYLSLVQESNPNGKISIKQE